MESEAQSTTVDFADLAEKDEAFAALWHASKQHLDFRDVRTVQQLSKSILHVHHGLQVDLPDDRLCPPVPVRYEYIKWLHGLIDSTSPSYSDSYEIERQVIGFDIGVGASCIYPLLGCQARSSWRFFGTEIDDKNYQYANRNIVTNGLLSRVTLLKRQSVDPLLDFDQIPASQIDFVMCNPPFFSSREDMLATYTNKAKPPPTVCTGADVEMITEGGDEGFMLRIVDESLIWRTRCLWYTCMAGKLQTVHAVVGRLKELELSNYAITCFQGGSITRRWGIAWSFSTFRPRNDIARGYTASKELLPFPTEVRLPIPILPHQGSLQNQLNELFGALDVAWDWEAESNSGICAARGNVWARAARRKKRHGAGPGSQQGADDNEHSFVVGLSVVAGSGQSLHIRWLNGSDKVVFESFVGMLKRKVSLAG